MRLDLKPVIALLLLITISKLQVNAGPLRNSDLEAASSGPKGNLNTTVTNMGEETNIPIGYQNPWEINGDIAIDKVSRSQIQMARRWPKTGIPMFYQDSFTAWEQCYIKLAVERIATYSCIPLKLFEVDSNCSTNNNISIEDCLMNGKTAWTKQKISETFPNTNLSAHVIYIPHKDTCNSEIGSIGSKQVINLSRRCFRNRMGTVIHETLHTMGYEHEQNRLDRDNYVTVIEENIIPGALSNFNKVSPTNFEDFGPYDIFSLLHYSSYAAAKDEDLRTIVAKDPLLDVKYLRIGKREDVTKIDKTKIRAITYCPGETYEDHLAAVTKIDNNLAKILSNSIKNLGHAKSKCEALA